jgi:hypothetical protein
MAYIVWVAPHEHHERPHEEGHPPVVAALVPLERQHAAYDLQRKSPQGKRLETTLPEKIRWQYKSMLFKSGSCQVTKNWS